MLSTAEPVLAQPLTTKTKCVLYSLFCTDALAPLFETCPRGLPIGWKVKGNWRVLRLVLHWFNPGLWQKFFNPGLQKKSARQPKSGYKFSVEMKNRMMSMASSDGSGPQIGSGQPWLEFGFGKFPLKMSNISIFPLGSKKNFLGQVKKYLGQRQVGFLFTAGQK